MPLDLLDSASARRAVLITLPPWLFHSHFPSTPFNLPRPLRQPRPGTPLLSLFLLLLVGGECKVQNAECWMQLGSCLAPEMEIVFILRKAILMWIFTPAFPWISSWIFHRFARNWNCNWHGHALHAFVGHRRHKAPHWEEGYGSADGNHSAAALFSSWFISDARIWAWLQCRRRSRRRRLLNAALVCCLLALVAGCWLLALLDVNVPARGSGSGRGFSYGYPRLTFTQNYRQASREGNV